MAQLLKDIKGFDDVGIGLIHCDKGEGKYIRCSDLDGYDLTGVQIYKYSNIFRTISPVDEIYELRNYAYYIKREDLL